MKKLFIILILFCAAEAVAQVTKVPGFPQFYAENLPAMQQGSVTTSLGGSNGFCCYASSLYPYDSLKNHPPAGRI